MIAKAMQIRRQVFCAGVAPRRLLVQALEANRLQIARHSRLELG
jgi:hypothetical protein